MLRQRKTHLKTPYIHIHPPDQAHPILTYALPSKLTTPCQSTIHTTIHCPPNVHHTPLYLPIPLSHKDQTHYTLTLTPKTTPSPTITKNALVMPPILPLIFTTHPHPMYLRPFRPVPADRPLLIHEAPGNDIARHVWDAGVATASSLPYFLSDKSPLKELSAHVRRALARGEGGMKVVELGAGCAAVSAALLRVFSSSGEAQTAGSEIVLSDLLEAESMALRNVRLAAERREGVETRFVPLDWDSVAYVGAGALPSGLRRGWDVVMASDVTYNPSSVPALVRTVGALEACAREEGREVLVLVAGKERHKDEEVFWGEMEGAGWRVRERSAVWCPLMEGVDVGEEGGGEWVWVCVFWRGP